MKMNLFYPVVFCILHILTVSQGVAQMKDVVFRQYDIRGKVGSDLDISQAYDLARAIAYYFVEKNPNVKTIAVGMDGRTHSPELKEKICAGLIDSGLNVQFVGTCPSPVVYFALHNYPVDAGLMITASHNGKEYNGIKICLGTQSVCGDQIQEIKQFFKQKKSLNSFAPGVVTNIDAKDKYIAWLADNFKHLKNKDFSVVVDCGNGAAGTVMPQLVKLMGWNNVQLLYPEVDGTYPNHDADPTKEQNMADVKQILLKSDNTIGIGFDGDVDRMVGMTETGQLVPGDIMLGILSAPIIEKHKNSAIVFDITSSSALAEFLEQRGAQPVMCPTGSSYIKQYMKKNGALFGGEVSCHFFFADRYFGYDDGVYAMLRLLEIIVDSGKTLQELSEDFPKKYSSPGIRIPCSEDQKKIIVSGVKDYFAGGEAFRIDFALRIAISKLLARRAGTSLQTLIIDEGFGSQDEEGLSNIMDAIYKIQDDFSKVIIVSHLPAMKDQFPIHFLVEKHAHGSHVRVLEQG